MCRSTGRAGPGFFHDMKGTDDMTDVKVVMSCTVSLARGWMHRPIGRRSTPVRANSAASTALPAPYVPGPNCDDAGVTL